MDNVEAETVCAIYAGAIFAVVDASRLIMCA